MKFLLSFTLCFLASYVLAYDPSTREDVQAFVQELVANHGFEAETVVQVLSGAKKQDSILTLISKPAEKKPWEAYREIFVTPQRVKDGVQFMAENKETLERAHAKFGVPPKMVTAIIGVETNYGRNKGSHRVIDALTTLGFDYPPRAAFFRGQLQEFFILACEERLVPFDNENACHRGTATQTLGSTVAMSDLVGSYAGAMGYGQFIPSSYRNFAIDFNGDGRRDIWNDVEDAIGSVAAYFEQHGWTRDGLVIEEIAIGDATVDTLSLANETYKPNKQVREWRELGFETGSIEDDLQASLFNFERADQATHYLGFQNFYAITRYNISRLYAMAVWQVATEISNQLP